MRREPIFIFMMYRMVRINNKNNCSKILVKSTFSYYSSQISVFLYILHFSDKLVLLESFSSSILIKQTLLTKDHVPHKNSFTSNCSLPKKLNYTTKQIQYTSGIMYHNNKIPNHAYTQ